MPPVTVVIIISSAQKSLSLLELLHKTHFKRLFGSFPDCYLSFSDLFIVCLILILVNLSLKLLFQVISENLDHQLLTLA